LGGRWCCACATSLRQDGRAAQLDTCLDGPFDFRLGKGLWPA